MQIIPTLAKHSKHSNHSHIVIKYVSTSLEICKQLTLGWYLWVRQRSTYPYPPELFHWRLGEYTVAPVTMKLTWRLGVNTSHESSAENQPNKTKQSITKPLPYSIRYAVYLFLFCSTESIRGNLLVIPTTQLLHVLQLLACWLDKSYPST